jgi:hypothetical protein
MANYFLKSNFKKSLEITRYEFELLKLINYDKMYFSKGKNSSQDVIVDDGGDITKFEIKTQTTEGVAVIELRQRNCCYQQSPIYADPIKDPLKWFDSGITLSESDYYVLFYREKNTKNYNKVYMIPTEAIRNVIDQELKDYKIDYDKNTNTYVDNGGLWSKELKRLTPLLELHNPDFRPDLGIGMYFKKPTKNMFIDSDDEKPADVIEGIKMTKDINFTTKFVDNNRGIIINLNLIRLLGYCNSNGFNVIELGGRSLDKGNNLITKHFKKCIDKDVDGITYEFLEFTKKITSSTLSIQELMNIDCLNYHSSDNEDSDSDNEHIEQTKNTTEIDDENDNKEDWYKYGKNKEWFYSASGKGLELMNLINK